MCLGVKLMTFIFRLTDGEDHHIGTFDSLEKAKAHAQNQEEEMAREVGDVPITIIWMRRDNVYPEPGYDFITTNSHYWIQPAELQ